MYKVAILYICTGKYKVFWNEFYQSCEQYFLKDIAQVEYFVWTDDLHFIPPKDNIHQIYQASESWPFATLKRFEYFLSQKERLQKFDFVFFMNANLLFVAPVGLEFLPLEQDLMVVNHPGFYDKDPAIFTYERNPSSTACIMVGEGDYYVAGGLNGGKRAAFLAMCETLANNIQRDQDNNVMAIWHDESHLNRYIATYSQYKLLDPSYLYPEGWQLPFEAKIIVREKSNYFDVDDFKGYKKEKASSLSKIWRGLKRKFPF